MKSLQESSTEFPEISFDIFQKAPLEEFQEKISEISLTFQDAHLYDHKTAPFMVVLNFFQRHASWRVKDFSEESLGDFKHDSPQIFEQLSLAKSLRVPPKTISGISPAISSQISLTVYLDFSTETASVSFAEIFSDQIFWNFPKIYFGIPS